MSEMTQGSKGVQKSMKRISSKVHVFDKESKGDVDWRTPRATTTEHKEGEADPDEKAEKSKTTFNNQNTIVMLALTKPKNPKDPIDIMMMHDTRIFYFSCNKKVQGWVDIDEANDGLVNIMLGMLTKKKYRILSTFYLLFRLSDNTILLVLVISLFLGDADLTEIITKNFRVFTVLGVELFYGVMEYTVKVWILNRVSLYVGLVLYGLYALAFTATGLWAPIVHMLFWCRFLSFSCEIITDYCIDLEVSYDLKQRKITNLRLWGNKLYACIKEHCICECCFGKNGEGTGQSDVKNQIELQAGVKNQKFSQEKPVSPPQPPQPPQPQGELSINIKLSPPIRPVNDMILDDQPSPVSKDIIIYNDEENHFPSVRPELLNIESFTRNRSPTTHDREIVGTDRINLPTGWEYKGSTCSWTLKNAFRPKYKKNYKPTKAHRCWFSLMLLVTLILGFPLLVIVGVLAACLGGLYVCCKKCNDCRKAKGKDPLCQGTICGEFWQEYSF